MSARYVIQDAAEDVRAWYFTTKAIERSIFKNNKALLNMVDSLVHIHGKDKALASRIQNHAWVQGLV